MNEKIVLTAQGYDRVDGRNAYQSTVKKKLTLGAPVNEENKKVRLRRNSGKKTRTASWQLAWSFRSIRSLI